MSTTSLIRRAGALLPALLLVVTTTSLLTPGSSSADVGAATTTTTATGTAGVAGTVRGVNETTGFDGALAGAPVRVADAATGQTLRWTTTDAQGGFTVSALPAVAVKVQVRKEGWLVTYVGGGRAWREAPSFDLTAGTTRVLPSTTVFAEAVITGETLGWMDPLDGVTVTVFDADTGKVLAREVNGTYDWTYRIGQLPPGRIKVRGTRSGWLTDWADDRDTWDQARVFTLRSGQTLAQSWDPITLYLDLTPESVITGTVRGIDEDPVSGSQAPLAGARVTVLDAGTGRAVASTTSSQDPAGAFRIGGLRGGDYKVKVSKPGWVTTYVPNVFGLGDAMSFQVQPGATLDLGTLSLYAPATVAGEVLSWSDPLDGATVTAYDAQTGKVLGREVNGVGDWTFAIGGLPPVPVKLKATKPGYLTDWAINRSSFETAVTIPLRPGVVQRTVDENDIYLDLEPGGVLTGSTFGLNDDPYNGWDDPVPGAKVTVVDAVTGAYVASTVTTDDPYGGFRLDGLPNGTYKIKVSKTGWLTSWATQAFTFKDASTFTIDATHKYVEVGTIHMFAPAAVSGQVLGWMDPLGDATVKVFDAATGRVLGSYVTDASGEYRIGGLPPVPVKVRGSKTGWVSSWANGKWSSATADVFDLSSGVTLQQSWDPMVLYIDLRPVTGGS